MVRTTNRLGTLRAAEQRFYKSLYILSKAGRNVRHRKSKNESHAVKSGEGGMVKLSIRLDEQVDFNVTGHPSDNTAMLNLELSGDRAMSIWLILEDMLEEAGYIWEDK